MQESASSFNRLMLIVGKARERKKILYVKKNNNKGLLWVSRWGGGWGGGGGELFQVGAGANQIKRWEE